LARITKAQREAAELSRLATRRAEAYRLHCQGWTQEKIAQHQGIDQTTVSTDLAKHRSTIPPEDLAKVRQDHIRQLAMLRESMYELSQMDGAPVTSGKEGLVVYDPTTGAVVRDYSLRIAAVKETRFLIEREAKQLGVDASAKVELSGEVATTGSVEQQLAEMVKALGLGPAGMPIASDSQSSPGLTDAERP
jgi:hypothetical protein